MRSIPVSGILAGENLLEILGRIPFDERLRFSTILEYRCKSYMSRIDIQMFPNFRCPLLVCHLAAECQIESFAIIWL